MALSRVRRTLAAAVIRNAYEGDDVHEAIRQGLDDVARAARDLYTLYQEKNAAESVAAARWYNGLERAVYTLEAHPRRCPLAPESKANQPLRHLLYGKKPHVYRVINEIDEPKKLVQVLTIRHGAMEPAELNE